MAKVDVLVVGGGMAGLSAALEAAEAGHSALLVEKEPFLGGRVARMHRFFPKLCPPNCGLELYFRRIKTNPNVTYFTQARVAKVSGERPNFTVTLSVQPRFVLSDRCTACGDCVRACPVERADDFNYGLGKTKAIYVPSLMAMPPKYVIDQEACRGSSCAECVSACRYGAIDLMMKPQSLTYQVGSIVVATGWEPYDITRFAGLGFGKLPNVVTNVIFERYAEPAGPTGGRILRPSDGKEVSRIAFVQCAGSRDENHLPYCSAVCCMASLKQITYVREQSPDAHVYAFFMDVRAPGRYEDFYRKVSGDDHVHVVRGKVAKIEEDGATRDLIIEADDTIYGGKTRIPVQMAVLATGTVPAGAREALPGLALVSDQYGFLLADGVPGVHPAGVAKRPMDVSSSVRDGTGAALRAIQDVVEG